MGETAIEWTDETWNCVRGCTQVSPGCVNCYAKHQAARIVRMAKGKPSKYDGLVRLTARGEPAWTGEVVLDPVKLADPMRWKRPRRIFVNSMSDLFHEKLSNEEIAAVFGVMAAAPQHTFQVLTKRAKRMREWFEWCDGPLHCIQHALMTVGLGGAADRTLTTVGGANQTDWPLPNVWLGVSVENQDAADERILELLSTPAAVRFLSCEPLLGNVDIRCPRCHGQGRRFVEGRSSNPALGRPLALVRCECSERDKVTIDWVIAGCESGPGARPCDVAWLRSLRDQCADAGTAFFLKQAMYTLGDEHSGERDAITGGPDSNDKRGALIGLPYLDGVQHAAFPPNQGALSTEK